VPRDHPNPLQVPLLSIPLLIFGRQFSREDPRIDSYTGLWSIGPYLIVWILHGRARSELFALVRVVDAQKLHFEDQGGPAGDLGALRMIGEAWCRDKVSRLRGGRTYSK
jgi:hypothetical protein